MCTKLMSLVCADSMQLPLRSHPDEILCSRQATSCVLPYGRACMSAVAAMLVVWQLCNGAVIRPAALTPPCCFQTDRNQWSGGQGRLQPAHELA